MSQGTYKPRHMVFDCILVIIIILERIMYKPPKA